MIRLLLVDDHTIFRSGMKRLLEDEPDLKVADEAKDTTEMLSKLRCGAFDVILLDVSLAGRSGLDALASMRAERPGLPVLMLSMFPAEQYALAALKAGAAGYLTKDVGATELVAAIRQVARGERYLSAAAAHRLLLQLERADNGPPHQRLSAREHVIMGLIVQGISLTDIGERMFISVKTVSTYRSRILRKLGVESNAELVRYAMQHQMSS